MHSDAAAGGFPYSIETAAQFDDHYCTVWRVAWNITGTVLASSGDDGCVRLWKCELKLTTPIDKQLYNFKMAIYFSYC